MCSPVHVEIYQPTGYKTSRYMNISKRLSDSAIAAGQAPAGHAQKVTSYFPHDKILHLRRRKVARKGRECKTEVRMAKILRDRPSTHGPLRGVIDIKLTAHLLLSDIRCLIIFVEEASIRASAQQGHHPRPQLVMRAIMDVLYHPADCVFGQNPPRYQVHCCCRSQVGVVYRL